MRSWLVEFFELIGTLLRAIPAPNETWAEIIGHVAWPITTVTVVVVMRRELKRIAATLNERLAKSGFEISPSGVSFPAPDVVDLDQPQVADPSAPPGDDEVRVRLIAWVAEEDHLNKLKAWLSENGQEFQKLRRFLIEQKYAMLHRKAFSALMEEGRDG